MDIIRPDVNNSHAVSNASKTSTHRPAPKLKTYKPAVKTAEDPTQLTTEDTETSQKTQDQKTNKDNPINYDSDNKSLST